MSLFMPNYINNKNVNEYLFDIDEKEQENLTSDIICSICLTRPTEPDVSNNDENNSVDNKFCHLSCTSTHKFHSNCITTWLKRNLTCPCCRVVPEKKKIIIIVDTQILINEWKNVHLE
jgi:hypothetical protein